MRILFDARLLLPQMTGIGRYIINLMRNLAKIDNENSYTVLVNPSSRQLSLWEDLKATNWRTRVLDVPEIGLRNQIQTPWALRAGNFNILHHPHFDLPFLMSVSSVVTIHDLKYILYPDLFPDYGKAKMAYIRNIMRVSVKKAKRIIAVSESTKRDIVNRFNINPERIEVIHLAVDDKLNVSKSHSELNRFLSTKRITNDYFLFVGDRRPHKNLPRLIEAFDIYKSRTKADDDLFIIGKPYSGYDGPEKKITELGLQDRVKIIGYVDDDELSSYYGGCKALIMPSLYEGFGIPLLEAMSHGAPVITSNLSSMPEVVGEAALLANPHDVNEMAEQMIKLHQIPGIRNDLILKGVKQLRHFSWMKTAEKTYSVYVDV